jgi:predicted NACHT family NTPase
MFRTARDQKQKGWRDIVGQTRGLVFLATPHSGASFANWISSFGTVLRKTVSVDELKANSPQLLELNLWFRNNFRDLGINVKIYYEKYLMSGVLVVDASSADPGIENIIPIPLDNNHITICQPRSKDALIYRSLKKFIGEWFSTQSSTCLESPEKDRAKSNPAVDIDELVLELREKFRTGIQRQCGTMRILNMEQAITLDDIYTDVQIFERVSSKQFKAILEYQEETANVDFNQYGFYGLELKTKRIAGIEAVQNYDKLMVLGRPGAGKTTFLKRLAILCLGGSILTDRVPIFVNLQEFYKTKLSLIDFAVQKYQGCVTVAELEQLLSAGRGFVLLDGLDEVSQDEVARISKNIQEWAVKFSSRFIVTCRLAAKESIFEGFKEVQVADFNDEQVNSFVTKWFQAKAPQKITSFLDKLETNSRIKEQARNPLLLTLLCLIFEEESNLIENRAELYEKGIDLLLERWDTKMDIQRDEIYKHLSTKRKEDLLSHIALSTFGENNYFFKRARGEEFITAYIQNLPEAVNDPETLRVDSKKILSSIEAQHGLLMERASDIYSFSHLTFHEYFVSRQLITVQKSSPDALQNLIAHINEPKWREVFLIATEMSPRADDLLLEMKKAIDAMLAKDNKLQEMLVWLKEKAISIKAPYNLPAVRAFYFDCAFSLAFALSRIPSDISIALAISRALDMSLDYARRFSLPLSLSHSLDIALDHSLFLDISTALSLDISTALSFPNALASVIASINAQKIGDESLYSSLQALKERLPDVNAPCEVRENWWQQNGKQWFKDFCQSTIKHRNIGQDWQFTSEQRELLQQYSAANKLLVDCLKSKCCISREVRQQIEDTLLLPSKQGFFKWLSHRFEWVISRG